MRKYFSHLPAFLIIFLLIFSVTGLVFPQTAQATPYEDCRKDPDKTLEECELLLGAPPSPEQEAVDKSLSWGGWVLDKTVKPAVAWIATTILQLVSLLTALGGVILNGVIYLTIVKVADNYSNLTSINSTWSVVRDLANMGFIFVLLYASINTILGRGEDNKKLIVKIIIAAILINFSLFFTKIVIDISNILALLFYDAMVPSGSLSNFNIAQTGLSNAFMQRLNLTNLYHITQGATISIEGIITIGVMGSIMLLIAAFVFFAVAIMLVIRYVILILVLILSPIAFVSSILPGLSDKGKQWWNALSGQAFFAPVYFMLTWITLNMLDGVMNQTVGTLGVTSTISTSSLASIALDPSGNLSQQGAIPMFINFIIVIIFLIASLIIAKDWANKAGPGAAGLTKWAMGAAGGASFGLAGRAGRYTAGAAAEGFKGTRWYKQLEAKSADKTAGGMAARLSLAATDKTRRASFDVRGSRLGSVLAGADLEAGQAGGQGGVEAERTRVREFFERPGTESRKKRLERSRRARGELDVTNNLSAAEEFDAINAAVAAAGGVATPAQTARLAALQPQVDAMERAINNATTREIEAIIESNRKLLASQELANRISVQQLDALNKSDKFTETEKDELKARRFGEINAALAVGGAGVASVRTNIRRLSDTELEMVDPALLGNAHFVSQLQPAQIEAVNKSTKFTTSQKGNLRTARRAPLLAAIGIGNVVAAQNALRELGHKEIAALDMATLLNPTMLQAYIPQMLKRMAPEMNPADITPLRNAIIVAGAPASAWLASPDGAIFS